MNSSATVLHIGEETTHVIAGTAPRPDPLLVLPIGSRKTARDHFQHTPPTALELEEAIAAVEDEVAKARAVVGKDRRLFTKDDVARQIALAAGVPNSTDMTLTVEAVEQAFQHLAAQSLGKPASRDRSAIENERAAALLILRELMHHLQFATILVRADRRTASDA